jgi:hypothetical protein
MAAFYLPIFRLVTFDRYIPKSPQSFRSAFALHSHSSLQEII